MQRVLGRYISNLMLHNDININDMDIDLYAIIVFNTIILQKQWPKCFGKMWCCPHQKPGTTHPLISLTKIPWLYASTHLLFFLPPHGTPDLKENPCSHLRSCGQMVFASGPGDNYLIRDNDKEIPTLVLTSTLWACGIQYVRILHFGTKMPYNFFPLQGYIVVR